MLPYCLKRRKNTEDINQRISRTSNGKTMILSKCAICGSKKSKFIKEKEAKGLEQLQVKFHYWEIFVLNAIPSSAILLKKNSV